MSALLEGVVDEVAVAALLLCSVLVVNRLQEGVGLVQLRPLFFRSTRSYSHLAT